jgi:hypothetical protein
MGIWDSYRFADYGVVLGIDFLVIRIHLLVIELREIEEMASLELIVPRLAYTGLIQKQGSFTLGDAFIFMVLDLSEERG